MNKEKTTIINSQNDNKIYPESENYIYNSEPYILVERSIPEDEDMRQKYVKEILKIEKNKIVKQYKQDNNCDDNDIKVIFNDKLASEIGTTVLIINTKNPEKSEKYFLKAGFHIGRGGGIEDIKKELIQASMQLEFAKIIRQYEKDKIFNRPKPEYSNKGRTCRNKDEVDPVTGITFYNSMSTTTPYEKASIYIDKKYLDLKKVSLNTICNGKEQTYDYEKEHYNDNSYKVKLIANKEYMDNILEKQLDNDDSYAISEDDNEYYKCYYEDFQKKKFLFLEKLKEQYDEQKISNKSGKKYNKDKKNFSQYKSLFNDLGYNNIISNVRQDKFIDQDNKTTIVSIAKNNLGVFDLQLLLNNVLLECMETSSAITGNNKKRYEDILIYCINSENDKQLLEQQMKELSKSIKNFRDNYKCDSYYVATGNPEMRYTDTERNNCNVCVDQGVHYEKDRANGLLDNATTIFSALNHKERMKFIDKLKIITPIAKGVKEEELKTEIINSQKNINRKSLIQCFLPVLFGAKDVDLDNIVLLNDGTFQSVDFNANPNIHQYAYDKNKDNEEIKNEMPNVLIKFENLFSNKDDSKEFVYDKDQKLWNYKNEKKELEEYKKREELKNNKNLKLKNNQYSCKNEEELNKFIEDVFGNDIKIISENDEENKEYDKAKLDEGRYMNTFLIKKNGKLIGKIEFKKESRYENATTHEIEIIKGLTTIERYAENQEEVFMRVDRKQILGDQYDKIMQLVEKSKSASGITELKDAETVANLLVKFTLFTETKKSRRELTWKFTDGLFSLPNNKDKDEDKNIIYLNTLQDSIDRVYKLTMEQKHINLDKIRPISDFVESVRKMEATLTNIGVNKQCLEEVLKLDKILQIEQQVKQLEDIKDINSSLVKLEKGDDDITEDKVIDKINKMLTYNYKQENKEDKEIIRDNLDILFKKIKIAYHKLGEVRCYPVKKLFELCFGKNGKEGKINCINNNFNEEEREELKQLASSIIDEKEKIYNDRKKQISMVKNVINEQVKNDNNDIVKNQHYNSDDKNNKKIENSKKINNLTNNYGTIYPYRDSQKDNVNNNSVNNKIQPDKVSQTKYETKQQSETIKDIYATLSDLGQKESEGKVIKKINDMLSNNGEKNNDKEVIKTNLIKLLSPAMKLLNLCFKENKIDCLENLSNNEKEEIKQPLLPLITTQKENKTSQINNNVKTTKTISKLKNGNKIINNNNLLSNIKLKQTNNFILPNTINNRYNNIENINNKKNKVSKSNCINKINGTIKKGILTKNFKKDDIIKIKKEEAKLLTTINSKSYLKKGNNEIFQKGQ